MRARDAEWVCDVFECLTAATCCFFISCFALFQDGRLERSLEAAMMLMESFVGSERRFQYALVGHSGDSASIPFVEFGKPPANRKERLAVLQRMLAHSQFCMSGDHTLEAAAEAVEAVADPALGEADEMMAFVISDANL